MNDRLWAPWRYDYVSSPAGGDGICVFCLLASGDGCGEEEDYVIHRGKRAFVVLNRYPYINGHLMIVPCRHVPDLSSLMPEETAELMDLAIMAEVALRKGMKCQGLNGGWNTGSAGGAGIPSHFHMHMLPRWNGDTNFMTTVGGVRVLSQSLEEACSILRPYFGGH
jgi:ATP adenylyltransferase